MHKVNLISIEPKLGLTLNLSLFFLLNISIQKHGTNTDYNKLNKYSLLAFELIGKTISYKLLHIREKNKSVY